MFSLPFSHCIKISDLVTPTDFEKLGGDPCGGWEEDTGLDLDVNLNGIPRYSQESAVEALHQEEDPETNVLHEFNVENISDSEHNGF